MKEFLKKHIYVIAIAIIAIVLIGYIYKDNTNHAHDLQFHIANIQNLVSNNLKVDLVMPNIGNNLGYGLYIFYPMLSHFAYAIVASLLSIFNVKTIDSILVTNLIVSIVSSIAMYILVLEVSKSKKQAFIAGIIYLLFPYRLGTITVRMALAENFAGIFIPIILLGIYYLFKDEKNKFYITFILGYTGLILSHYIIAMYFSIFVIIILLFYIDKIFKEKRYIKILIATLAVTVLVLPNMIIFLEHYGENYLVYLDNYVTSIELIKMEGLKLSEFFMPEANYDWTVPFYIYWPVIGFYVLSVIFAVKKHKREDILNVVLIGICVFMITCMQFWDILPKIFYNIQFSWRIELMLTVFIAIFAPKFLEKFDDKNLTHKYNQIVFGVTIVLCILPSLFLINKLNNRIWHKDYTIIDMEKGTGNLSEYYPQNYIYDEEYYKNKKEIDIITGSGEVTVTKNKGSKLEFTVKNSEDLIVELPRIYYKGYKLTRNGEEVVFVNDPYGLISLGARDGEYKLQYTGTFLYNMFRVIRIIAIVTAISILGVNYAKKRKEKNS